MLSANTTLSTRSAGAYLSRQPIFRKHLDVYAYELLFSGGPTAHGAEVLGR